MVSPVSVKVSVANSSVVPMVSPLVSVAIVWPNITVTTDTMVTRVMTIPPPVPNITSMGPIMPYVMSRTFIDNIIISSRQVSHINNIVWL